VFPLEKNIPPIFLDEAEENFPCLNLVFE